MYFTIKSIENNVFHVDNYDTRLGIDSTLGYLLVQTRILFSRFDGTCVAPPKVS